MDDALRDVRVIESYMHEKNNGKSIFFGNRGLTRCSRLARSIQVTGQSTVLTSVCLKKHSIWLLDLTFIINYLNQISRRLFLSIWFLKIFLQTTPLLAFSHKCMEEINGLQIFTKNPHLTSTPWRGKNFPLLWRAISLN